MSRRWSWGLAGGLAGAVLFWATATLASAASRSDGATQIRAVLAEQSLAQAQTAVVVIRLPSGGRSTPTVVFRHNGDVPLLPASNLKVITSAAALETLGRDFRFRTELLLRDSDLYLLGDGDPTLGDPTLTRRVGWTYDTVFRQWAAELLKRGVRQVRNIYVDDSIFDGQRVHPNWPENQLHFAYAAEVGGLNFHFNTVEVLARARQGGTVELSLTPPTRYVELRNEVRVGDKPGLAGARAAGSNRVVVRGELRPGTEDSFAITISDPALYAAEVFREVLAREGVRVTGGLSRVEQTRAAMTATPRAFTPVGVLETPLSVVLARCNKDSANLYAESLAKRLAAHATGRPGSWDGYRQTAGAFLRRLGIPEGQAVLDDGCGLSRGNRLSADALTAVLVREFTAANRDLFFESLAVGGVDGTLRSRFTDDLRGRVYGKSGFINQVFTLSGYLRARDGDWYAFAILFNGASGVRPLHERIVRAIDAGGW